MFGRECASEFVTPTMLVAWMGELNDGFRSYSRGMARRSFDRNMHQITSVAMGTMVSIEVVADLPAAVVRPALERALDWFSLVEKACSRFDAGSELQQLCAHVGTPVPLSPLLFELLRFSLALARETRGAFDPTVGARLESQGFNLHYLTGEIISSGVPVATNVSYKEVKLDTKRKTVTLRRPLLVDLGGVAKGFAVDLAARELSEFDGFCVEAGGDLFVGGRSPQGKHWQIGVQHPREPGTVFCTINVSNQAVCTSGDYERPAPDGGGHHLIDPRTGRSPDALVSATVIASTCLIADALSTTAFVLGPTAGMQLLERHDVEGMLITSSGETYSTSGFTGLLT